MQTIILGDGHLGWAIAAAAGERGERTPILGRPAFDRHDRAALAGADLVIDASRGEAVRGNVETALDAGVRRFVIATTGAVPTPPPSSRPTSVLASRCSPGSWRLRRNCSAVSMASIRSSSSGIGGLRPTGRRGPRWSSPAG